MPMLFQLAIAISLISGFHGIFSGVEAFPGTSFITSYVHANGRGGTTTIFSPSMNCIKTALLKTSRFLPCEYCIRRQRAPIRAFLRRSAVFAHQESSMTGGDKNNDDFCIRILCLHGKGGDGKSFVNKSLRPLRDMLKNRNADNKVSFQWEEVTAPFPLDPNDETKGYSWWTMPPGVRSYNAKEYIGFEESESIVMNSIFPNDGDISNFDIVLGHSQGAILTAALLSKQEKLRGDSTNSAPIGYILNGVAWPNPFSDNLASTRCNELTNTDNQSNNPRMLFIMGKADKINPIESAKKVHDAYDKAGFGVSIVEHDGGHSVPLGKDHDSSHALEDVADWIIDVTKMKELSPRKV